MKKTLVSALTTALVVGAASTTFAAANPFADVPADHWAYDAVAQLVQDGVINGYTDGSFTGDQNMTRYEMAQIVAKAMARTDAADNNNKALIDKLAAEFSDELANLGVRVANLEAKMDNVKWNGNVRYDWTNQNFENSTLHRAHDTEKVDNGLQLRLEPSMTINENWSAHARLQAKINKDDDDTDTTDMKYIYTEGVYNKFDVKLGKLPTFSDASHGLVIDDQITGIEMTYAPTDTWKVKATAGRYSKLAKTLGVTTSDNKGATYWAVEANYNNAKWDAGVGYHYMGSTNTYQELGVEEKNSSFHVIDLGLGYAFDKNVKLTADYAFGPSIDGSNVLADATGAKSDGDMNNAAKNAYSVQLNYKGADFAQRGSWGAYVAYRQYAPFASFCATQDLSSGFYGLKSLKGWEIGADYAFAKNIIGTAKYFSGKDTLLSNNDSVNGVFTRVEFVF